VGTAPFSGVRSTLIDDGVAPAVIGRLIHPSLNMSGSFAVVAPLPPKVGNRPAGAGLHFQCFPTQALTMVSTRFQASAHTHAGRTNERLLATSSSITITDNTAFREITTTTTSSVQLAQQKARIEQTIHRLGRARSDAACPRGAEDGAAPVLRVCGPVQRQCHRAHQYR
jgi:hypothetical protein